MTQRPFIDYYEVLQLGQNADQETVERVYRLLAKRYHPDNQATGNGKRFAEVSEAHQILSDPKRRTEYDVRYDENRSMQWKIFDQTSAADGREEDRRLFHGILSLLYVARRRDPIGGGLGTVSLEKLLGVPRQHMEFPLWYLRQRGWVQIMDNGTLAITVEGIDKMADKELSLPADRLLNASPVVEAAKRAKAEPAAGDADSEEQMLTEGEAEAPTPISDPAAGRPPFPVDDEDDDIVIQPSAASSFPSESDAAPLSDDEVGEAAKRTREVAQRLRTGRL